MTIRPSERSSASSLQQPPRNRRSLKVTLFVAGLIVLIALSGIGWWLFSPLFVHNTSNASNPFAVPATNSPAATVLTPTTTGSTPTPAGPRVLAAGKFIDNLNSGRGLANDHGSGNVTIGKTADGKYTIHLDTLKVTNGPDLHIYLSTPKNPDQPAQVTGGGEDLGTLSATEGAVNVEIPAAIGARLTQYQSVVIYCKTFSVIFTIAPLQFSTTR